MTDLEHILPLWSELESAGADYVLATVVAVEGSSYRRPGARMLLYKLWRRDIPAGLVTGNLSRIGWKKMECAGLKCYLRFGAFAELAADRAGLVRIAVRHARRQGWIDRSSPVALIGDHPNDIRAARANGVRSIAVCTGLIGADELSQHAPDILVEDMRALSVEMLIGS